MADTVDMNATHNSGAVVGQNNGTMVNHFTVPPVDVVSQCITALFVTDARADREGISSTKGSIVEGTCNWVKQHSSYVTWLHSPSDSLWVIGGPGKRKTMLAVYLTKPWIRFVATRSCHSPTSSATIAIQVETPFVRFFGRYWPRS
jgi:hypothetical protein